MTGLAPSDKDSKQKALSSPPNPDTAGGDVPPLTAQASGPEHHRLVADVRAGPSRAQTAGDFPSLLLKTAPSKGQGDEACLATSPGLQP